VAIAAMGTFTFGWLFTGSYPWGLSLICALDWFIVNLLNRVVDLEEDRVNAITGTDFVSRNRGALQVLGFGALVGSLVAVHTIWPELTPYRLAYHALGLTYNWPLLPGKRRIKQLYFFKNTASAMGFVLTVFCYPLAVSGWALAGGTGDVTLATTVTVGLFFVLFELSYEVIYDLRDEEGDRAAGVRTFAVVHGQAGATRIIDALIAASVVVISVGYFAGWVPWRFFVMLVAPLVNLAYYKRALRRGITSADCIRLTWLGAGLLVAYHLWVVAGLPGVNA